MNVDPILLALVGVVCLPWVWVWVWRDYSSGDDESPARFDLSAEAAEMHRVLLAVVAGRTRHIYQGSCPDENDPEARDSECRACNLLIEAAAAAHRRPSEPL